MKIIKLFGALIIFCIVVGSASADVISFNAATSVITVTGFNATHPCTFLDIYNADVAGGWGVINQITPWCYYINGSCFYIGNSTHDGYFGDINKEIIIKMPSGQTYVFNAYPNKCYLEFGEIANALLKTTKNGCSFTIEGYTDMDAIHFCKNPTELYLYGCKIQKYKYTTSATISLTNTNGSIWHTHFNNGFYLYNAANVLDIYDITISTCSQAFLMFTTTLPINKVNTYSTTTTLFLYHPSTTFIDFECEDITHCFWLYLPTDHHYLINTIMDWSRPKIYTHSFDYKVMRQYTFNLQTSPNAKITITNHTDMVYQGYAYDNGTIDEQILTMGNYMQASGDTLNSQNPFSIQIAKPGYQTYFHTFNLTEPTMWDIGLEPDIFTIPKTKSLTGLIFLTLCLFASLGIIIFKKGDKK